MKKKILTAVQIIVTVSVLCWVFHNPKTRADMWNAITHAKPIWLLAGFLCYGIVELLGVTRWFILLRVQGIRLPTWRIGALFMVGIFFNQLLPGGIGGDALKIFFLLKEVPKKKAGGLLAVLMDRLIGLMALILISSGIIAVQYHWLMTTPASRNLTWILLLILVSGLGGITFSFVISGFGLADKLPAKMPMRDVLIDLSVAYNAYAKAWPASLAALAVSLGIHACSFCVFYCASLALNVQTSSGAPLPFGALMTIMPIILTISSLPISMGGTGPREAMFSALLVPLCGVDPAVAYMLSLTGWAMSAAWAMLGGVIYLLYRPSEHAKLSEVERQVHELEHEIAEAE